MTVSINGTNGLTFNDGSTQAAAATGFGFKNRIINGAMVIDQRNAGASVAATTADYSLDRWCMTYSAATKFSVQRNAASVTPPAGFSNYLGVTSSSAYSITSSDYFGVFQTIEGFNIADLGWGTANASTVTLSFWVRSSLTGTFGGALKNATSGATRSYPFTFTISAANTWELETITVAGDTSGTWNSTNGAGLCVQFGLGVGSTFSGTAGSWSGSNFLSATGATSVVGTNGATFYITGVQLEKGSTATSFDYRPYGTEFDLCRRYYQTWGGNSAFERLGIGFNYSTTQMRAIIPLGVTMRSAPTLTVSAAGDWVVEGTSTQTCTSIALDQASSKIAACNFNVASGLTAGQGGQAVVNNTTNARFNLSSEL